MTDKVTVWECVGCECRGPGPLTVQHSVTCTDGTRARPLTFTLGWGQARPLF